MLTAANEAEIDRGIRLVDAQIAREQTTRAKAEAVEARRQKAINRRLNQVSNRRQRPRTPSPPPIDPALLSSPPYPTEEMSRYLLALGPKEDDLPYRITAPISPPPLRRNTTWREAVEEGSTEVATDEEAEAVE